ncbi:MAG TPA: MFS transporter [Dehalococcoidia bacterium]|nr:MFS transporter [Dehalococcoidia bacterium]
MPTPASDIPRFNRIVYASGSVAGNVISRSSALWLIFFFAPPAEEKELPTLIPRLTLGIIILAISFLDSIDDPLIGFWSDRTQTRWGRRLPFVVFSTPIYAVTFALMWFPPGAEAGHFANAAFFFFFVWLHRLFSTLSGGPFGALLPEIAITPEERVSIVTWQVLFGAIGAVIGLVVSGLIKDAFSFQAMGITMAVIAFGSRYVAMAGAWRYTRTDVAPVTANPVRAFRDTISNRQFLYFLPTFVLSSMAVTLLTAMLPFYAEAVVIPDGSLEADVLGLSLDLEEGAISAILTAVAIAMVVLALPLVYRLSVSRGKAWVYSTAMLLGSLGFPFIFFMGFVPGIPVMLQSLLFVAFIGLPMAAVFTFPNAFMADVIDYDELRTGMRREAIYYGALSTIEKWASSLYAPILALILLAGETADDPLGIRLAGPVAGLASFLGYLCFRGYRLPDEVTAESVRAAGLSVGGPPPA